MSLLRNFLLILIISGCARKTKVDDIHSFFLLKDIEEGFVNKYYVHSVPTEGQKATDIVYDQYRSVNENQIVISTFNAGMELVEERTLQFEGGKLKMLSDKWTSIYDTTDVDIINPDFLSFNYHVPTELHLKRKINKERFSETHTIKELVKDSIVSGKRAVIFKEKMAIEEYSNGDTARAEVVGMITYVEGVGSFHRKKKFPEGTQIFELVEQMPLSAFKELQNHTLKRIGYIDPSNTLDENKNFKLCFNEEMTHDYYNSSPERRYSEGKKAMVKIIFSKLQKEKLHDESGYLTFRFVVNCHGEAGRFVTEESSLDFEKKKFNPETVKHLFSIMHQDLKRWRPVITDEARDAYFYITFKLRNGEIIDILP